MASLDEFAMILVVCPICMTPAAAGLKSPILANAAPIRFVLVPIQ